MARWHFSIMLVPAGWAKANLNTLSDFLRSGWDLTKAWQGHTVDFYPGFLPPDEAWSMELLTWQSSTSDSRIYLRLEEDDVIYFQVQFDLRSNCNELINDVCAYAASNGLWLLLMEERRLIPPATDRLRNSAASSRAAKRYPIRQD